MDSRVSSARVVEHHRLRHDVAVVRLVGRYVPFRAGQSVFVQVPRNPGLLRRLSPALPPSLDGKLEFHVRTVPGGWVSNTIVAHTNPGDVWQIGEPTGGFTVDPAGPDVLMIAGGTGLAPLRSILLELARLPNPPHVDLFIGGLFPRDLYASDMLWILAAKLPWLTITPVVEAIEDPAWPDEWYDATRVGIGFTPDDLVRGTLGEAVTYYGAFPDRQILVCGSPAMVTATVRDLVATGTPADNIQVDYG